MSSITTATSVQESQAPDALLVPTEPLRVELDVRELNTATVTLYWIRGTDLAVVAVADEADGPSFELVLDPHERALDAFHHPYAYAAARGVI
jgi:hypothetical protein